jgi:energy-converting hydrogenase A subunit M
MLNPLVMNIPTVIKDSKSFVNMIESLYIDNEHFIDCVLLVADISSLYTMIPTDEGIAMMRRF